MFSIDIEKEKKDKKEREQKEMMDYYKKLKAREEEGDAVEDHGKAQKNEDAKKAEKGNIFSFLQKQWFSNPHLNYFAKCMFPFLAIVGVGGIAIGAGWLIGEISTLAPFLSGLNLPKSITHIIATASFWQLAGIVAGCCFIFFVVTMAFSKVKSLVQEGRAGNEKGKKVHENKEKEIVQKKQHSNARQNENKTITKEQVENMILGGKLDDLRKIFGCEDQELPREFKRLVLTNNLEGVKHYIKKNQYARNGNEFSAYSCGGRTIAKQAKMSKINFNHHFAKQNAKFYAFGRKDNNFEINTSIKNRNQETVKRYRKKKYSTYNKQKNNNHCFKYKSSSSFRQNQKYF